MNSAKSCRHRTATSALQVAARGFGWHALVDENSDCLVDRAKVVECGRQRFAGRYRRGAAVLVYLDRLVAWAELAGQVIAE